MAATLALLVAVIAAFAYVAVERERDRTRALAQTADAMPLPAQNVGTAPTTSSRGLPPAAIDYLAQAGNTLEAVVRAPAGAWQPYADMPPPAGSGAPLWLRVTLASPPPGDGAVLALTSTSYSAQRMLVPSLGLDTVRQRNRPQAQDGWSARSLVFDVPRGLPAGAPIYLKLDARAGRAPDIRLHEMRSYHAIDAAAARRVHVLAGALGGLLFVVAVFWRLFNDRAFLQYGMYLGAITLFILCDTDVAYAMPVLDQLAVLGQHASWLFAALSGAFMISFAGAFVDLPRYSPRSWAAARQVRNLLLLLAPPLLVPGLALAWYPPVVNVLLLLGFLCVVGGSIAALPSGNLYARFFLLGWVPLVGVTAARIAMAMGLLEFHRAYETVLHLGVLWEAGVLMFALAWRVHSRVAPAPGVPSC